MSSSPKLSEQVILITGASAGIGAALAQRLAQQYPGVRLVLAARTEAALQQVAQACEAAGATVLVVPTDLAQVPQAEALADKTLAHFGQIDALVNNAGYGQMGPIELVPSAACERQFAVNVLGPLALTRRVIPAMRDRGQGRIINISSIAGRTAFPFGGLYSASKFALEALSDALRMELEPFNIAVSVVEPGPVTTDFFAVVRTQVEQTIPAPLNTPYRAAFENLAGLEAQTRANAWTADRVAVVILQALRDRRPKPRYLAATGGKFLLFLLTKALPTRAVDRFWQKFYAIDRVAADWSDPRSSE